MMGNDISMFQAITLAVAVLGAVLGVINTWHGLDRSRIKLKVVPAHAIPVGGCDGRLRFCIEITNLSTFPVTVCDAGVFYYGTNVRGSIINPVFADGGSWPRRLEPRSSVTIYSQLPDSENGKRIRCAYARTQCGCIKIGHSQALHQIAKQIPGATL